MKSWLQHARPVVVAALAALAVTACDEKLDSGLACPALCPPQQIDARDTTLLAIALDTSIAGYPTFGNESELVLASMGDTIQTRGIVRYDSLPVTFRRVNSTEDSVIVAVDTGAYLALRIPERDTLSDAPGDSVTVELYDVDMGETDDSDPSRAAAGFTPDRLIGSRRFPMDSVRDSIKVPIDPSVILSKVQADSPFVRLRIGLKVAAGPQVLRVFTTNAGGAPLLVFRPSDNDSIAAVTIVPQSKYPADLFTRLERADYLLVPVAPPPPPSDVVRVGGLPARRVYLRFSIPPSILDSSSVVRATLVLHQRSAPDAPLPDDSIAIAPFEVTASSLVRDIDRALVFLRQVTGSTDSLRVVASGSGQRAFEMIGIVRNWRLTDSTITPRAVALRSTLEASSVHHADFYSIEAPEALRPRLRITYLPRRPEGLP